MATEHSIDLARQSWRHLRGYVSDPSTYTDTAMLFRASQLACKLDELIDEKSMPVPPDPEDVHPVELEALNAWGDARLDMVLTEKQRDCCKQVLTSRTKSGKVQPHKYTLELLEAFGLAPTD